VDFKLSKSLFSGIELFHRDLDVPIVSGATVRTETQREDYDQVYLSWILNNNFTLATKYLYEKYKREIQASSAINEPSEVKTTIIPLVLTYHNNIGLFSTLEANYVDQEVVQPTSATTFAHNQDNFWVLDLGLGYKLAKRNGTISVTVNNLLDEDFNYHDVAFRSGTAQSPRFSHERSYLIKASFSLN
jgi:outer membrane receptor protein involved in Fe transport